MERKALTAQVARTGTDTTLSQIQRLVAEAQTSRSRYQNLAWATGYNAIALPLAAGVLAGVGFLLSPAVGAVLMSASTVVVAINAMLLRRTRLSATT